MTTAAERTAALTFTGRHAVVTGAASGIGAAVTRLLTDAGVRTLAVDVSEPDNRHGLQVGRAIDVRDGAALRSAVQQAFPDPVVNYVVNCAGIPARTGFRGVSATEWRTLLDVNLIGAYTVIDTCAEFFDEGAPGAVVNITSMEASRVIALTNPDPNPHYAASKAALAMLTRTAARALGPRTRVNSIAPGFIATPMASEHGGTVDLPPTLAARVVADRWGQPEDVAHAVLFLLSDQADYITGAELCVDGGWATT